MSTATARPHKRTTKIPPIHRRVYWLQFSKRIDLKKNWHWKLSSNLIEIHTESRQIWFNFKKGSWISKISSHSGSKSAIDRDENENSIGSISMSNHLRIKTAYLNEKTKIKTHSLLVQIIISEQIRSRLDKPLAGGVHKDSQLEAEIETSPILSTPSVALVPLDLSKRWQLSDEFFHHLLYSMWMIPFSCSSRMASESLSLHGDPANIINGNGRLL